jgi:hypothetical protein
MLPEPMLPPPLFIGMFPMFPGSMGMEPVLLSMGVEFPVPMPPFMGMLPMLPLLLLLLILLLFGLMAGPMAFIIPPIMPAMPLMAPMAPPPMAIAQPSVRVIARIKAKQMDTHLEIFMDSLTP